MNKEQHLLLIAMEELTELAVECNLAAQRISKAIRFGTKQIQPGQLLDNAQRLIDEFNDVQAVMELLREANYIPPFMDRQKVQAKKDKVRHFMAYSEECLNTIFNETSTTNESDERVIP